MSRGDLEEFVALGHASGMEVALAGNIGFQHLEMLQQIDPDILGVRGIVCGGDRNSSINSELVKRLKLALSANP
jgi:uncharacterized protein (UPF0264 family)